jgi:hypothetical protein
MAISAVCPGSSQATKASKLPSLDPVPLGLATAAAAAAAEPRSSGGFLRQLQSGRRAEALPRGSVCPPGAPCGSAGGRRGLNGASAGKGPPGRFCSAGGGIGGWTSHTCLYFRLTRRTKKNSSTAVLLVMVLFVWQNQKSWYECRFRFFQNRMVNPCRIFFEYGFPHNFAKNDRQELKIGCTDASRRQLQSVLKIGV